MDIYVVGMETVLYIGFYESSPSSYWVSSTRRSHSRKLALFTNAGGKIVTGEY